MSTLPILTSSPSDLDAVVARVREGLKARRWFHLPGPSSEEEFHAVVSRLGTVSRQMDVVVSPDREREQRAARRNNLPRPSIYQSAEMDFHTDPPPSDILAFYCVVQDDVDGSNLLIDLERIERDFTPEEVDGLCRIEIAYSYQGPGNHDHLGTLNLVTRHPDGATVNYMPWGLRRQEDPVLADLLERFERYVREQPVVSLRLAAGGCLFLDNRRTLHGRGPLSPDSRRHLLRLHVTCADA
jgi:hypothetical protein